MKMGLPQDPVPRHTNQVSVIVPHEVAYSLERLQKVLANVMGRLGHPGCTSGFDLRLIMEREFVVDAKTLAVEGINQADRG